MKNHSKMIAPDLWDLRIQSWSKPHIHVPSSNHICHFIVIWPSQSLTKTIIQLINLIQPQSLSIQYFNQMNHFSPYWRSFSLPWNDHSDHHSLHILNHFKVPQIRDIDNHSSISRIHSYSIYEMKTTNDQKLSNIGVPRMIKMSFCLPFMPFKWFILNHQSMIILIKNDQRIVESFQSEKSDLRSFESYNHSFWSILI